MPVIPNDMLCYANSCLVHVNVFEEFPNSSPRHFDPSNLGGCRKGGGVKGRSGFEFFFSELRIA